MADCLPQGGVAGRVKTSAYTDSRGLNTHARASGKCTRSMKRVSSSALLRDVQTSQVGRPRAQFSVLKVSLKPRPRQVGCFPVAPVRRQAPRPGPEGPPRVEHSRGGGRGVGCADTDQSAALFLSAGRRERWLFSPGRPAPEAPPAPRSETAACPQGDADQGGPPAAPAPAGRGPHALRRPSGHQEHPGDPPGQEGAPAPPWRRGPRGRRIWREGAPGAQLRPDRGTRDPSFLGSPVACRSTPPAVTF